MIFLKVSGNSTQLPRDICDDNNVIVTPAPFNAFLVSKCLDGSLLYITLNDTEYNTWVSENSPFGIEQLTEKQANEELRKSPRNEYRASINMTVPNYYNFLIKSEVRDYVNRTAGDIQDRIADVSKLVCLLLGATSQIYEALPAAQKDSMDPELKSLMELAFTKYNETEDSLDAHREHDSDYSIITKLFSRESKIGLKVKEYLNKKV